MKRRASKVSKSFAKPNLQLFWFLVAFSFVALVLYRGLFNLPVWFDEIVAKAFIFGLPVLVYAVASRQKSLSFGMEPGRFWLGAYLGLALGGSFGFVAMLASAVKTGGPILIPNLFLAKDFWWAFFLALGTAWWESLFFYGLNLNVLQTAYKNEWRANLMATGLFVLFHAPILVLRGSVAGAIVPLFLLALFAFGQGVIYLRFRSLMAMIVSHAFWGMALLVYTLR